MPPFPFLQQDQLIWNFDFSIFQSKQASCSCFGLLQFFVPFPNDSDSWSCFRRSFLIKEDFLLSAISKIWGSKEGKAFFGRCAHLWQSNRSQTKFNVSWIDRVCPCVMQVFHLASEERGQQPLHWAARHWYWIVSPPPPHLFLLLFFGSEATPAWNGPTLEPFSVGRDQPACLSSSICHYHCHE